MTPAGDGDVSVERSERPSMEGALGELIEVEERIEAAVAMAEAEAERLVDAARRNLRALEVDGSSSLEEALAALGASVDEECAVSLRTLAERAEAEVERYRHVEEATLRRLARWVASRVAGGSRDP